jgi:hypothetical protein
MEGRLKILAVIHTIVEHAAGFVNLFTIMMGKTPRFLRKKPFTDREKFCIMENSDLRGA